MKYEGKLFIDDKDAVLEYGVFIEQYGLGGLIQMPSFKKLTSTEWPEENGSEVDLLSPVLDTKQFQLKFCILNVRYANDLFSDLADGAYHTFRFTELGKTYTLRMLQNGSFTQCIEKGKMTLTFADDFPTVPTQDVSELDTSDVRQIGYSIDDVEFYEFGSFVLKGTDENIQKAANVRENLKIDVSTLAGLKYDASEVRFKTKDVTLKLLIDAPSITEFWKRWNALFAVLMQPEERVFYYRALNAEYDCYYKSNSVSKFEILRSGKVWCEFNVVLTFTNWNAETSWMLLATEDFNWVITEDSEDPARILVRPKSGISLLISEDGAFIITETDDNKIYLNNA